MSELPEGDRQGLLVRAMTVAHLREPPGANHVEVMFFESARFYRLPRDHRSFAAARRRLEEARATGRQVPIAFASATSDVIVEVGGSDDDAR